jgi:hypothetical protein
MNSAFRTALLRSGKTLRSRYESKEGRWNPSRKSALIPTLYGDRFGIVLLQASVVFENWLRNTRFNVPMQEHQTRKTDNKEADKYCKSIEKHVRRLAAPV